MPTTWPVGSALADGIVADRVAELIQVVRRIQHRASAKADPTNYIAVVPFTSSEGTMSPMMVGENGSGPKPLDYATPETRSWPVWADLLARFIWAMIVINIWGIAVLAPAFTAVGIVNLFHPVSGLEMFGRPVTTPGQKWHWIACNAILSSVFIPLACWHLHRRRRQQS